MFGTLFALFFFHGRQRDTEREKRLQYWREQVRPPFFFLLQPTDTQRPPSSPPLRPCLCPFPRLQNAFRQNILQMRDTARASIFSSGAAGSPRSTMYSRDGGDDSQAPLVQHAAPTKSSGLRHYVSDDGSYEQGNENEELVMSTPYTHDRKF